jgi:hypothetical protein
MASIVMSKKLQLGSGRKKDVTLILGCFRGATALQPYWNKWIVSGVWVEIINSLYDISDDVKFQAKPHLVYVHLGGHGGCFMKGNSPDMKIASNKLAQNSRQQSPKLGRQTNTDRSK